MSVEAIYIYTDERGRPILRKVRQSPKRFSVQAARYVNDRLYWKSNHGALGRYQPEWSGRAMYNLPVLLDALKHHQPVWLVEGERDCDTLSALRRAPTTTNYQGAKAFTETQAAWFMFARSRSVINIWIDNDPAGAWAAWQRYTNLIAVGVEKRRIRLYRPTGAAKDITDVALGGFRRAAIERVWPRAVQRDSFAEGAYEAAHGNGPDSNSGENPNTGFVWLTNEERAMGNTS